VAIFRYQMVYIILRTFNLLFPYELYDLAMNFKQVYTLLSDGLSPIYGDREASIIARYVIEDLFDQNFWSEENLSDQQATKFYNAIDRLKTSEPWPIFMV
jgi:hypothetical protein